MGLFVAEDGHYQLWLATILCCFAAVSEDEHPIERERSRPTTRTGTCQEQPTPLTALPRFPTSAYHSDSKGDEPDSPLHNYVPAPPPSLRPLDLGDSSFFTSQQHQRRWRNSNGHVKKSSISAPSAFRRLDHTDGQRSSLVPLRLGPVVLNDPPAPGRAVPMTATETSAVRSRTRSDSTENLLPSRKRESYLQHRETPFQRCQQRSSIMMTNAPSHTSFFDSSHSASTPAVPIADQRASSTPVSRQSSAGSLRRQALETSTAATSIRPSTERSRLKRKPSFQSVRKPYMDGPDDIEKEVLELNTIVEERRAEQRPKSPEQMHIAAIAPTMQVRARSETLNDIGSALARPLTAREPGRMSEVFDAPDRPTRPSTSRATSRTSSRVSGWLSGLLPLTTTAQTPSNEPFYKCVPPARQRAHSEASLCTSVTELDSPSLTVASSPTTKGHSRSLTAESRITPISPPSTIYDHDMRDVQKEADENWPIVVAHSQVGLAI